MYFNHAEAHSFLKVAENQLEKAFDLLPLVGSGADIFRTNTFRIFGQYIWSAYLLIWVPLVIGVLCLPPAVRGWSRRMRR